MKSGDFHFQWFEKEDARKALRVSIGKDGKMRLGRELRRQLPPRIRVGFDAQSRMLAIVQGGEEDILWPKVGIFNMRRLAAQITALGLTLPVAFRMEDRPGEGCYYGTVLPRKKKQPAGPGGQVVYDVEQLMALYRPLVDTLIYQTARTTPLAERLLQSGVSAARRAGPPKTQRARPFGRARGFVNQIKPFPRPTGRAARPAGARR